MSGVLLWAVRLVVVYVACCVPASLVAMYEYRDVEVTAASSLDVLQLTLPLAAFLMGFLALIAGIIAAGFWAFDRDGR